MRESAPLSCKACNEPFYDEDGMQISSKTQVEIRAEFKDADKTYAAPLATAAYTVVVCEDCAKELAEKHTQNAALATQGESAIVQT